MKTAAPFLRPAVLAFLLLLPLAARAAPGTAPAPAAEADEYAAPPVSDPLERVNRAIFKFNDGFYRDVLRPFARGYERVVPQPVRHALTNFFDNLRFPVRFVSSALQARPGRATRETGKFLLNSTLGIGGLVRISDAVPALAAVPDEDLGQTFGVWGIGAGPYLVLPFLGPSSVRDTAGLVGNSCLNPVGWSRARHTVKGYDAKWRHGLQAVDLLNTSPELLATYDSFKQAALDPYVAVRNGYLQHRAAAVKQ